LNTGYLKPSEYCRFLETSCTVHRILQAYEQKLYTSQSNTGTWIKVVQPTEYYMYLEHKLPTQYYRNFNTSCMAHSILEALRNISWLAHIIL